MVWGGRRLGDLLNKTLPADGPYGEAWEISDHASHQSVVCRGPRRGRTLRELMQEERRQLVGAAHHEAFPWLVKSLDAADWLSVQVHPDDEAARRLWPGERGKTEAWFVLDAAPGSKVFAGLASGVTRAALQRALAAGEVVGCLHQFEPRPGDCLFLPAGTVHAVGGGVLMAEVQQTSDATFRLFDWNRRDARGQARPLHVEQSLACIDWQAGPVNPVRAWGYPRAWGAAPDAGDETQRLTGCAYFVLDYWRRTAPFELGGDGRMAVVVVVHG
jgi:mannose-6-phosphate isomerase